MGGKIAKKQKQRIQQLVADLGIDKFDDTSYQPQRMMYWPSTSQDGEYFFEFIDGPALDPVLVLYAYTHDAERIKQRIPCRTLNTSADIDDWNSGRIPVAIAHPASIGHGLNLQYGGHITIWYGLTWSLELYQQANERLNRPGQTQVCRVYHLVAKETHDERILRALESKESGQAAAIEALKLEVVK